LSITAEADTSEFSKGSILPSFLASGQTNAFQASPKVLHEVSAQVVPPLKEAFVGLNRDETRAIKITLRPEELGRIEIEVKRGSEGRLSAQLLVERDATHHVLLNGIGQLRETMENAGLSLDRLEVSCGSDFSSLRGNQTGTGGRGGDAQSARFFETFAEDSSMANVETGGSETVLERLISLRA
jgi:flagellar hook-length control protein FliK